jgi:hypothetical protein
MNTEQHRFKGKLLFVIACCFPLLAAEPVLVSVSPSGGGEMREFTVTVSDSMGASDIGYVTLVIPGFSGESECRIGFDPVHERVESRGDCWATLVSSDARGADMTVTASVVFPSTWPADKAVWAAARDVAGNDTGYQLMAPAALRPRESWGVPARTHMAFLRWVASPTPDVTYNVYRASHSGGPYSKINSSAIGRTSYTDLSVFGGQSYYYVVTAVNADQVESMYSNESVATIPSN